MKSIRQVVLGIVAVTSLGMAAALHAQPAPGQGFGPGMGPMGMHGHPGMPGARGPGGTFDPAAMVDARLTKAKAALKIAGDPQEKAWNAIADHVKGQAAAMKGIRAAAIAEAKTTVPERMAQQILIAQHHVDNLKLLQPKVADLYALLSPDQRAVADKMIGRMHRRMGPPAN